MNARKDARNTARLHDIEQIEKAFLMYYDDHGYYPIIPAGFCCIDLSSGENCLESMMNHPGCDIYDDLAEYMKDIPQPPPYSFFPNDTPSYYAFYLTGAGLDLYWIFALLEGDAREFSAASCDEILHDPSYDHIQCGKNLRLR